MAWFKCYGKTMHCKHWHTLDCPMSAECRRAAPRKTNVYYCDHTGRKLKYEGILFTVNLTNNTYNYIVLHNGDIIRFQKDFDQYISLATGELYIAVHQHYDVSKTHFDELLGFAPIRNIDYI